MPREDNVRALVDHFLGDLAALIHREAVAAVDAILATFKPTPQARAAAPLLDVPLAPPLPRTKAASSAPSSSSPSPSTRKAPRAKAPRRKKARAEATVAGDGAEVGSRDQAVLSLDSPAAVTEPSSAPPRDPEPAAVHQAEVEPPPNPIVESLATFYRNEWRRGRRAGRTLEQLAETASVNAVELAPVVAALVDQGHLVRRDVTNDYAASKVWLRG